MMNLTTDISRSGSCFWKLLASAAFLVVVFVSGQHTAHAQAIVTFDSSSSADTGSAQLNQLTFSHTVATGGVNRFLVVAVSLHRVNGSCDANGMNCTGTLPQVTSIIYNGIALTNNNLATANSTDNNKRIEVWTLVNPPVSSNLIVVTLSAAGTMVAGSVSATSVDQVTPITSATSGNNTSSSTPTVLLTINGGNRSLTVDVLGVGNSISVTGSGAGQIQEWQRTTTNSPVPPPQANDIRGVGSTNRDPNAGFQVLSYTLNTNTPWVMGALALQPAASVSEVRLDSFKASHYIASAESKGGVLLSWRTGFESNNLGFNIYRERDGKQEQITRDIVAGSALSTRSELSVGYSYAWWDGAGQAGDRYYLEDIDLRGNQERSGPYAASTVAGGAPVEENSALLGRYGSQQVRQSETYRGEMPNRLAAKAKGGSAGAGRSQSTQFGLAAGNSVKIGVRENGWYRITPRDLATAGYNTSSLDPRLLRLYSDGVEQAIRVTGEEDGQFDAGDAIEFYGTHLDTQSTGTRTYWLASSGGLGKRMKVSRRVGRVGTSPSFSSTVELKERLVYFAALSNGDTENFFGRVVSSSPVPHKLTLDGVDPAVSGGQLEVALQGVTLGGHNVSVAVNGQPVGQIAYDAKGHTVAQIAVPPGVLVAGTNTVTLTGGPSADANLVDYMRMTYTRRPMAASNAMLYNVASQEGPVLFDGFTSPQVRVVDITNPGTAREILGRVTQTASGYAVTVTPKLATRQLLVFGPDTVLSPASIAVNQPSTWHAASNAADYVIVTHGSLIGSAAPLKALRELQGYKVAVVNVEDLYDEFSYGNHTPQAVRDFVTQAVSTWQTGPRFVTLLGKGSYDPRNYLGVGNFDLVPAKLIDTSEIEVASDDWLVDTNNDTVPDVAVGRLPVRNVTEAQTVIKKIVAHELSTTVNRTALFVSDIDDTADFTLNSKILRAQLPSDFAVQEILRGSVDDATARQQVVQGINLGPAITNYAGHGSVDLWRGHLLDNADAPNLVNGNRLSVFVMSNCLNGYHADPLLDSLGASLLVAPNGGAYAVLASSGNSNPYSQQSVAYQFYRRLFGAQPVTIGEAVMGAKGDIRGEVSRTFNLLGDPATRLR